MNSSYKTELSDPQPLYRGATELSLGTAEWVNRPGFDAASFCVKDGDYGQALPGRAA